MRAEPYAGKLPEGLAAWRILYTTTDLNAAPALASGVVAAPKSAGRELPPVIAWAHGTVGIARACAPSLTPTAISVETVPALNAILRNGWAVVAPDYTGMGTEGDMPYLVGEGEARSVLDGIRAARRLAEVKLSDQTVIWGHSQGGHAALWTAQLAPSYAPDLNLVGTAALAPASELPVIAEDLASKGPAASIVLAYALTAYVETYDDVRLGDFVPTSARTLVREIAARCPPTEGVGSRPDAMVSLLDLIAVSGDRPLFDFDFASDPLADRLEENVPDGPFPQPLFIGWGTADEVIPPATQDTYVDSLCASGQPLEYRTYPNKTHMGVLHDDDSALPADLEQWTRDRLKGLPPKVTCTSASRSDVRTSHDRRRFSR